VRKGSQAIFAAEEERRKTEQVFLLDQESSVAVRPTSERGRSGAHGERKEALSLS